MSTRPSSSRRLLLAVPFAVLWALGCGDASARSLELGDRFMAVGETDQAIAEYKLARRQQGDAPDVLLRLGHAYAVRGDVDEALAHLRPLAERDPAYRHQVASDLVALAAASRDRGAVENMSRSVEPLLEWGIGFVSQDLLLSLARHFADDGDYVRALGLYLAVLAESSEPDPATVYETGRAYAELGGCERAVPYFERYVAEAGRRAPDQDAARWNLGNCLFQIADEDRAAGRPAAALEKLDTMISLGVPRTILDNAHFLRGEMLLSLGDTESAIGAYQRVLDLNPARTGALVRRAEQRIRQIRFGVPDG